MDPSDCLPQSNIRAPVAISGSPRGSPLKPNNTDTKHIITGHTDGATHTGPTAAFSTSIASRLIRFVAVAHLASVWRGRKGGMRSRGSLVRDGP